MAKSPLLIPLSILDICCDICLSHPSSGYLQVFFSFQFRRFWGMALSASLQQRAMEQVQCMLITLSTSRFLGSEFLETFSHCLLSYETIWPNGAIVTLSSFPSCYRQGNWCQSGWNFFLDWRELHWYNNSKETHFLLSYDPLPNAYPKPH